MTSFTLLHACIEKYPRNPVATFQSCSMAPPASLVPILSMLGTCCIASSRLGHFPAIHAIAPYLALLASPTRSLSRPPTVTLSSALSFPIQSTPACSLYDAKLPNLQTTLGVRAPFPDRRLVILGSLLATYAPYQATYYSAFGMEQSFLSFRNIFQYHPIVRGNDIEHIAVECMR